MKKLMAIIISTIILIPLSTTLADVPSVLNYQGYIEDAGGVPINGPGYLKFAIVNQAGDTSYWSNDGTSTTGDEPNDYVTVVVSNGFFSLKLGDTSLTNMAVLDTTPFEEQDIYVRAWFSDTGLSFQQLTPDTQIASAGFAYKAQTVEQVPPGTVDWVDIANIPDGFADGVDDVGDTGAVDWGNLTGVPSGFADGVDDVGITSESDPTVAASVKDGVSWSEISSIPPGFADGVDNVGITSESDPTVAASVKDGVSWGEVSSIPAGFADGIDNDSGGDITSVTAGSYLSGGGSSGGVTLNVAGMPGIEFSNIGSVSNISTSVTNCGSIVLTAPQAGFVFVQISGWANTFGAQTRVWVGIGDDTTTIDFSTGAGQIDGSDTIRRTYSINASGVYSVAAGSKSYYLLAQRDPVFSTASVNLGDLHISAIYFPARY